MRNSERNSGITLVSLVITIIIIIILATVTINMAFGDNGLITQAQRAKDMTANSIVAEQEGMNSVLSEYLNVMAEDSEITPSEPPVEEPPTITNILKSHITSNSISITVVATPGTSEIVSYIYSITGQEQVTVPDSSHTFTGLIAGTSYEIKVMVVDKSGKISEDSIQATTEESGISDAIKNGTEFETTTEIKDDSGISVWIPGGFEIAGDSATDTDDGIVITNKENTKQFVWVPVDTTSLNEMYQIANGTKLNGVTTTTNVYSKLRTKVRPTSGNAETATIPGNVNGVREPDVLSRFDTDSKYYSILGYGSTKDMADAMVQEYTATYNSIKKYKGFYIGRYELTGSVDEPTVQKGQLVLTNQNWYYLNKACSNVVNNSYVQSIMIYGNQWDEVMDWIIDTGGKSVSEVNEDSANWGNYSNTDGTKRVSGYSEAWKVNNIYDLAGNCYEWTQETSHEYNRILMGGSCGGSSTYNPASVRNGYVTGTPTVDSETSSRVTLILK